VFRKQGGLLPWFHAHTRRDQARQKQALSHSRCSTTNKHQNGEIICGSLQLFPDSKDFAIIAAPFFKVTRKDFGYKNGPLPPDALHAFKVLQQQLTSDPVMAFPRSDRQYALITDAATGTAEFSGRLGAILTQVDKNGNHYVISFASRQLKDHEKNYSPFLLEAAAAVWGMEVFNEYLKGKQFILFTDHKPLEKLGHLHTKTFSIVLMLVGSQKMNIAKGAMTLSIPSLAINDTQLK
jgi:hypothetical protein